jgi:putative FmdB family regulatory protein
MPLYEYQCKTCGETTEVLQSAKDKPLEKCPKCGGAVAKLISPSAIQFKGSGWYITDYAKKGDATSERKAGGKAGSKDAKKAGADDGAAAKPAKSENPAS